MRTLSIIAILVFAISIVSGALSKSVNKSFLFVSLQIDTIVIGNKTPNPPNPGSKFMTHLDALIVNLPQQGLLLKSVEMYFPALQPASSHDSKIWVKSANTCTGGAAPFRNDPFTIGTSDVINIDTGWNLYSFDPPLQIDFDTIFIWPDYTMGPLPRIEYALGNNVDLYNLNNFLCASPQFGISPLDYRCELTFLKRPDCAPSLTISKYDSTCFAADTIHLQQTIDSSKFISILSKSIVSFDTLFEIKETSSLFVDMEGCN